mmetsp:Transcript_13519/g.19873  ORF Transcript_13519/g.19873 Transcript_13519/m.19873 type:complete len:149 (-) Transcript_13519:170-616(-)
MRSGVGIGDGGRQILSSLPLQILLYFNGWYSFSFFFLNLIIFGYKGYKYFYSMGTLAWEIILLFLLGSVDTSRLFFASKGNKTEQIPPLLWSIALSFPIIFGHSYFMTLQTYVLRLDVVINVIALAFTASEVALSIITFMRFYRSFRG